jgi:hypothetical protein
MDMSGRGVQPFQGLEEHKIMCPGKSLLVGLVGLLTLALLPGVSMAEEPDLAALLREAVAVHRKDLESWQSYSFRREVRRERLNKKGEVEWSLEFVLRVTPSTSGFDEELIEIEGRSPTEGEIKEHRKAARFTKQYKELLAGKVDHVLADDRITLPAIWEASDHSYGGLENIDGAPAHRIDFVPQPEQKKPMTERLADSIEGTIWVTVDGNHLLQWQTRLVRPLSRGLVKMEQLDLRVKCKRVGDAYLAEEAQVDVIVNLGTGDVRKRNRYRYSDFEESPPGS